jgi:hypothetical protein
VKEVRRDRKGHDRVGVGDLVVGQPDALAPEQYADALARAGADRLHRLLGTVDPLHLPALARRGREHVVEVGDGLLHAGVDGRGVEDVRGAGGRLPHALLGPAVLRVDEAQVRQAEIRHGAGRHADVLGELGLDQDDGGRDARRDLEALHGGPAMGNAPP